MTTYTQNDLIGRVLTRLGEVGMGQAQEPEARRRVSDALPGILAELVLDDIYDFGPQDEVPLPALDPLAAIVASRLADDFAVPQDEAAVLASRAQDAVARLRRYRALPVENAATRQHYF